MPDDFEFHEDMRDESLPHPLFGNGPWRTRDRNSVGDIIVTDFDGEKVTQRTLFDRDKYRAHLRDARGQYVGSNGFSKDRDLRHIADVPLHIWLKWEKEYGINALNHDRKLMRRLVNEYGLALVDGGSF